MADLSCTICHENYTSTDEIHSTECGHIFHLHCLEQCRKQYLGSCPVCRTYNPTTHRIYLDFNNIQYAEDGKEDKFKKLGRKMEQLLLRSGELEKRLQESESKYSNFQKQYKQNEEKLEELNEKIENWTPLGEVQQKKINLQSLPMKIQLLEERIKQASLHLENEIRNSTDLTADKLKLQSTLDKINAGETADLSASDDCDSVTMLLDLVNQLEAKLREVYAELEKENQKTKELFTDKVAYQSMLDQKETVERSEEMILREKMNLLDVKLEQVHLLLVKEVRNSADLAADKMRLQFSLHQKISKTREESIVEAKLREKIHVLQEKLRDACMELGKEIRYSTELAVEKMRLQDSALDQGYAAETSSASKPFIDL